MSKEAQQIKDQELNESSEPMVPKTTSPKQPEKPEKPEEQEKATDETKKPTENELEETKEKLFRLAAEYENYKKISEREQIKQLKYANENLITNLLPLIDNLEQAISLGKKAEHKETKDLVTGVDMVFKQLVDILKKFNIEIFSAQGKKFDPARHEAVGEREHSEYEDQIVIEEYQKGYLLAGRLLRPARVIVSKKVQDNPGKEEK